MIPLLTATILLSEVASKLLELWLWDVAVLQHPWMYYPLLIPATLFAVFMCVKWTILTVPVWAPLVILLQALRGAK